VAADASTLRSRRSSRLRRWAAGFRRRETWAAYAFLSPWMFGFLALTAGPMIYSLVLSFTDYSIISPTHSVGTRNYDTLLHDPKVGLALRNTLLYSVMHVPGVMIVSLVLASLLNRVKRGGGFFRTIFYLPVMTPKVAVGVLFLLVFNGSNGIINRALGFFGIDGPFWTTDPNWIKPGLAIMSFWAVGTTVVIYLAALKAVPQQLYEAAAMDGAGPVRRFRDVTLPMISPALFFTFIVLTINSLQTFDEVYTAFFNLGGQSYRSDAALFYVIYLFQEAFANFHMGYASALAWLLFVIIGLITVVQIVLSRRFVYYEGERR
jgi:multiple sugar transport system permease protein